MRTATATATASVASATALAVALSGFGMAEPRDSSSAEVLLNRLQERAHRQPGNTRLQETLSLLSAKAAALATLQLERQLQ